MTKDPGNTMTEEFDCRSCSAAGCTSRKTDETTAQEVGSGAYLIVAAMVIIIVSLAVKWLF